MTIQRLDTSYEDETNISLPVTSRVRMYNMMKDWDDTKMMNIFRTFVIPDEIKDNSNYFHIYEADEDEWWENVSYKYYDTPKLWYVICMMNSIINPFEEIEPGQQIKILKANFMYVLLKDIDELSRQ